MLALESQSLQITQNGAVELLLIPGGRFRMGSAGERDSEQPVHDVEVKPFYLGRYPITNEEYARFLQANSDVAEPLFWSDRRFNQARQPVVGVSWHEACRFAEWAGGRLPSEAEWEYACRAGTTTAYCWGDEIGHNRANGGESGSPWSGKQTSPVGSFPPNDFGLYDTHGNVWEWCQDHWHDNYLGAPRNSMAWEDVGSQRVLRGGSWGSIPSTLRSAYRFRSYAVNRYDNIGFRLAQDP
jgi:formylglycine-generating enzyme required for sulfatase activity